MLLLLSYLVVQTLAFSLFRVAYMHVCVRVCMHGHVYVYARSLCVYMHACVNTPPLFTAATDAVYVGHLFPRLLSLKSIVFFLFLFSLLRNGRNLGFFPTDLSCFMNI